MVARRVSEESVEILANASGYQNTRIQKLICPVSLPAVVAEIFWAVIRYQQACLGWGALGSQRRIAIARNG